MSYCVVCEGIGSGHAYVCPQCKDRIAYPTLTLCIAKLETRIEELLVEIRKRGIYMPEQPRTEEKSPPIKEG